MLRFLWAISLAFAAYVPMNASASCGDTGLHVCDTIPADGATSVATDTHIVVFGTGVHRVLLDDTKLTANSFGIFEPAELQPDTTHVVTIEGDPGTETFEFTTGLGLGDNTARPTCRRTPASWCLAQGLRPRCSTARR